jgi:hypothetical protein
MRCNGDGVEAQKTCTRPTSVGAVHAVPAHAVVGRLAWCGRWPHAVKQNRLGWLRAALRCRPVCKTGLVQHTFPQPSPTGVRMVIMRRRGSRFRRWSVVAAILVGCFATIPVQAPASASLGQCAEFCVCLWRNTDFTGGFYQTRAANATYHDGDTFNDGYRLYDAANSAANRDRTWWVRLFEHHHYGGNYVSLLPDHTYRDLGRVGMANKLSSHYWFRP